jgi:hypothetical protein
MICKSSNPDMVDNFFASQGGESEISRPESFFHIHNNLNFASSVYSIHLPIVFCTLF